MTKSLSTYRTYSVGPLFLKHIATPCLHRLRLGYIMPVTLRLEDITSVTLHTPGWRYTYDITPVTLPVTLRQWHYVSGIMPGCDITPVVLHRWHYACDTIPGWHQWTSVTKIPSDTFLNVFITPFPDWGPPGFHTFVPPQQISQSTEANHTVVF